MKDQEIRNLKAKIMLDKQTVRHNRESHPRLKRLHEKLDDLEQAADQLRDEADALETPLQLKREVEREWSDVLDLLHPHQLDGESIYETAKRVIPM